MRVSVNAGLVGGTLKALVGGFVMMAGMPVAILVGASRHPDAFAILGGAMLVSGAFGLSLWLFIAVGELARLGLTLFAISLHRLGRAALRRVTG